MTSKLLSRRDLEFLLYEWLDVAALCDRPRFADHSRETFDSALDTAERIATEVFLPHRRKSDVEEPEFDGERVHLIPESKAAFDAFAAAGLLAAAQDYEYGGMQLPTAVDKACFAYVLAANVGSAGYPLLTTANANLLLAHGSPAQVDAFVRPMLAGRFAGTMCLSEPQAGSSLADITTRAEPDGDSPLGPRYRLFGNKMWISAGEHEITENIVHLVLAKIPGAPAGVKGISLFLVPRACSLRTAGRVSATTSRSPASTTRWVIAARSTRCSISARAVPPRRASGRRRLPRRRAASRARVHVPHDERGPHRRGPRAPWRSAMPATSSRSSTPATGRRAAP